MMKLMCSVFLCFITWQSGYTCFQESEFKEWKLVVQEIFRFLKADTSFMNLRPVRYSVVLDPNPDSLSQNPLCTRSLKLRDAILCSYHYNEVMIILFFALFYQCLFKTEHHSNSVKLIEVLIAICWSLALFLYLNGQVKFSELTLDAFRMLQCLEWEPSGSFFQETGARASQNGTTGSSQISHSQELIDITLPPNPRKAILYRPSVTHFLAVSFLSLIDRLQKNYLDFLGTVSSYIVEPVFQL